MDSETKLDKHTKFKETFKVSKLKVKEWEKTFVDTNGRKPTKDEMKNAPPQIQICYKNCWKIKSYFELKSIGISDGVETSQFLDETSELPKTQSYDNSPEEEHKSETPCSDITNTRSKGVWGAHLNKKETVKPASTSFNFSGLSTKLDLTLSQGSITKTRTSLKKRNKTIQSFQSFTDTLGVLDDTDTVSSDPKPIPPASSQPDMFLSEDLFRSEESQDAYATINTPASKELLAGASSKETVKDDSDGEDSALFPNWNLKHEPKEKAPKPSSSKPLQSGLRRKVDSDWLSRCTGIAPEPPATNEKQELPPSDKLEQGINLTNVRTSGEMEAKTSPKVVPESENDEKLPAQTLPPMSQAIQPIVLNRKEEVAGEAEMVASMSEITQTSKAVKRRNMLSSDEEEDTLQRDTAYEPDDSSGEKTKKTKAVKRRKRGSSVEEQEEEEFLLQTTKKSRKPPRKRQKTMKKEEEENQEKDDGQTEETQGPSDLNIYALGFEGAGVDNTNVRKITTAKERLEKKVLSGKANENFVKIDLKKKKGFVKGKNSGARLKRAEWKRKLDMKEGRKVKEWKCYNCGEAGHMAWQCTGKR